MVDLRQDESIAEGRGTLTLTLCERTSSMEDAGPDDTAIDMTLVATTCVATYIR